MHTVPLVASETHYIPPFMEGSIRRDPALEGSHTRVLPAGAAPGSFLQAAFRQQSAA